MRKFNKLKRIIKMAQKSGKGSINKKYALVTKRYQSVINIQVNQIDKYQLKSKHVFITKTL